MQVHETIGQARTWRSTLNGSLGLVPTMGALHDGHMALVRRARRENEFVAVTIFVNPRQFSPAEDFARYPRTLDRDLELLRAESVDAVFVPDAAEMYPPGARTEIHVRNLSERLEGASRPGHFSGVAVVVSKLFNIYQPARAYFGQKDAQQVIVIQKMVADLNMPIEIVVVETVRDQDGLAISSRNMFLSAEERAAASRIAGALVLAQDCFACGERSADRLRDLVSREIEKEPLLSIEYVSLADAETLDELEAIESTAVLSVAVYSGSTRLIDNIVFQVNSPCL